MNDVLLIAHRVIATNGAWSCFAAVGGTGHGANYLHGITSFEGEGNDGRCLHRGSKGREEWTINEVGIVLAQNLVGELHHLHTCNAESAALKTVHDLANQLTLYAAGLE